MFTQESESVRSLIISTEWHLEVSGHTQSHTLIDEGFNDGCTFLQAEHITGGHALNNSLVESGSASDRALNWIRLLRRVTLLCTWRLSALITDLHGQVEICLVFIGRPCIRDCVYVCQRMVVVARAAAAAAVSPASLRGVVMMRRPLQIWNVHH